jgi:proline dehydrogenase
MEVPTVPVLDFSNTEIAFQHLSNSQLNKAVWLFSLMNKPFLVKYGSAISLKAVEWRLPLADWAVQQTIFSQFVGGTTLAEAQKNIDLLARHSVLTILDYGAEAKERDEDFDHTRDEAIRAIEYAAKHQKIPVVSTKITGMARFALLERWQQPGPLDPEQQTEFDRVLSRVDAVCREAARLGVQIYIDAEESWIQDTIDHLVETMMERYNRQTAIVFNTFQMYRHDRLAFLQKSLDVATGANYILGAKLVRGAYMEKERDRAASLGLASPINHTKSATDQLYDDALRFCLTHADHIHTCCATHNAASNLLFARLIAQKGFAPKDPRFLFSQLLGMSDNITFNLAQAGYRVAKYMPYGTVKEVIPYLIRRAQENTAVTGDMSREYQLLKSEQQRRRK